MGGDARPTQFFEGFEVDDRLGEEFVEFCEASGGHAAGHGG